MSFTGTALPPSMKILLYSPCFITRNASEEKKDWKDVKNGFPLVMGDTLRTDALVTIVHLTGPNDDLLGFLVLYDKVEMTLGAINDSITKNFMVGLTFRFGTIDFTSNDQSVGLAIATDHCQVVTTGTVFRMTDDGVKTRVTVALGNVRMTSKQDQSTRDLTAGETLAHSPGRSVPIWEP